MKKTDKLNFGYYITKYFSDYLPNIKGLSKNTICSYRDTICLLLDFLETEQKFSLDNFSFENLSCEIITDFLNFQEVNRNVSINTRNQRLAAIKAFFHYVQMKEPRYFQLCENILNIPNKKCGNKIMPYFTVEEIEILINLPKTNTKSGLRDYLILLILYETGARAKELVELKRSNFHIGENSYVILTGKGEKSRRIPINNKLSSLYSEYIKVFKIAESDYLFKNKNGEEISTKGIEYILKKYVSEAKKIHPDKFKQKYSNHSVRRSKAIHLLEAGVNIVYIRDFLGHSSVTTTEIYAKTNTKFKEEQLLKYSKELNVSNKYEDDQKMQLLDYLHSLR